jgi:hypothetical protein
MNRDAPHAPPAAACNAHRAPTLRDACFARPQVPAGVRGRQTESPRHVAHASKGETCSKLTVSPETAGPFHRDFELCVGLFVSGLARQGDEGSLQVLWKDTSGVGSSAFAGRGVRLKLYQRVSTIGTRANPLALALECRFANSRSRRFPSNCDAPLSTQAWP